MKFIHLPAKTKSFSPLPHYKFICPKEEQDTQFWKELVVIFIEQRYNIEISQNRFLIFIYQGGPFHKLYFIVVNIKE